MRYYLDLEDGGPLVECRDVAQATLFASLWRTSHRFNDQHFLQLIAARIRDLSQVQHGPDGNRAGFRPA